jgi:hypothetical protein
VDEQNDLRVIVDCLEISFVSHVLSHGVAPRVQFVTTAFASARSEVTVDDHLVATLDPSATQARYVAPARVRC